MNLDNNVAETMEQETKDYQSNQNNQDIQRNQSNPNVDAFKKALLSTGRKGIEAVLEGLDKLGFFKAPASSKHHLACEGGLLQHSLNVYMQADVIRSAQIKLNPQMEERLPMNSIIIASLLHDVCKAEIYKKVMKNRKNKETGRWEEYETYDYDYSHCPLGHGEKSVIRLIRMGLELTEDEIAAIRWHMGAWDLPSSFEANKNLGAAQDKYPLVSVLMAADTLATRISEGSNV